MRRPARPRSGRRGREKRLAEMGAEAERLGGEE